jgi:ATP-dependent RNA helicase DDX19/DBP5
MFTGPFILQAIYTEMKFERPSKIQATTLPMILRRSEAGIFKDLIAQAHNGSGKTTCFVLAMLSRCGLRPALPVRL